MKNKPVYSVSDVKPRPFYAFKIRFLSPGFASPVSLVHESITSNKQVPFVVHHRTDEFIYVLEGRAVMFMGRRKFTIRKGDCISIPKGIRHAFKTAGSKMEALSIFSPPMTFKEPDAEITRSKDR